MVHMCVYVCLLERLHVCARLRVHAHPCTGDDAHMYACGCACGCGLAYVRMYLCTCVRVHACMNDYYIMLLHVRA